MEQGPFWGSDRTSSRLVSQEIPRLLWKPKIRYWFKTTLQWALFRASWI
jgi:hypothetical protein